MAMGSFARSAGLRCQRLRLSVNAQTCTWSTRPSRGDHLVMDLQDIYLVRLIGLSPSKRRRVIKLLKPRAKKMAVSRSRVATLDVRQPRVTPVMG
jgi:hypothetical protein